MPRLARLPAIPFAWYYVTLHVVAGRRLASTSAELDALVEFLRVAVQQTGAHLHAGYADAEEVHLALQTGEVPVSGLIRRLTLRHARFLNHLRGETGRLWRPHAHVVLIEHETWLVEVVHVIHWLGPLRRERGGGSYWSTDAVYRERAHTNWVTTGVVLRMLAHQSRNVRAQVDAYRHRFDVAPAPSVMALLSNGSPGEPRILGSEAFIRASQAAPARKGLSVRVVPEAALRDAVRQVIAQLLALCAYGAPRERSSWAARLTLAAVCSHSRARPLPMARGLTVAFAVKRRLATRAQLARFFGCGNSTVSARRQRRYEAEYEALLADSQRSGVGGPPDLGSGEGGEPFVSRNVPRGGNSGNTARCDEGQSDAPEARRNPVSVFGEDFILGACAAGLAGSEPCGLERHWVRHLCSSGRDEGLMRASELALRRAVQSVVRLLADIIPRPANAFQPPGMREPKPTEPCPCGSLESFAACCARWLRMSGVDFRGTAPPWPYALWSMDAPTRAAAWASGHVPLSACIDAAGVRPTEERDPLILARLKPIRRRGEAISSTDVHLIFARLWDASAGLDQVARPLSGGRAPMPRRVSLARAWQVLRELARREPASGLLVLDEAVLLVASGQVEDARVRLSSRLSLLEATGRIEIARVVRELLRQIESLTQSLAGRYACR